MTKEKAKEKAQEMADKTGLQTLVYRSLLNYDKPDDYGAAFTVPLWGEHAGEKFYPKR